MTTKAEKVAISLDSDLLQRAEHLRAQTGESRSALFGRALARLLDVESHRAKVERYIAAYQEASETDSEIEATRTSARRALAHLPWDGDED